MNVTNTLRSIFDSGVLSTYLTITSAAATYFRIPIGTTAQYIRGDGTLATLPSAGAITLQANGTNVINAANSLNFSSSFNVSGTGNNGAIALQATGISAGNYTNPTIQLNTFGQAINVSNGSAPTNGINGSNGSNGTNGINGTNASINLTVSGTGGNATYNAATGNLIIPTYESQLAFNATHFNRTGNNIAWNGFAVQSNGTALGNALTLNVSGAIANLSGATINITPTINIRQNGTDRGNFTSLNMTNATITASGNTANIAINASSGSSSGGSGLYEFFNLI